MGWCFETVNGKLAEIFFHHKKNGDPVIQGFCYVKAGEYKTKREKQHIKIDTKRYRFTYRNKKYFDQIRKKQVSPGSFA